MIPNYYKNSELYRGFTDQQREYWFDLTRDKFLHNVDTLYLNCYLKGDYNSISERLTSILEQYKELAEFEDFYIDSYDCFMKSGGIRFYPYVLDIKDCFKVLIMRKQFNADAVPIQIHIGSEFLWTQGEKEAVDKATDWLFHFLMDFDISLIDTSISRIDYAFHTNSIQNMTKFFKNINEMQVSNFKHWDKHGTFDGDYEDKLNTVYCGRRGGKNVFVRIYDKTQEVVDRGYKQFFYILWRKHKLISEYDMWIYERCFKESNFEYHYIARLKFYLEYGPDDGIKEMCKKYLNPNGTCEKEELIDFVNLITPTPTIVINIEYETMRRFYKSIEPFYHLIEYNKNTQQYLYKTYRLLDNKMFILDHLTEKVFRLIDVKDPAERKRDKRMHPLWVILRRAALKESKINKKLLRDYQKKMDIELIRLQTAKKIATLSLFEKGKNCDDLEQDIESYVSALSENIVREMTSYKPKKYRQIKTRIDSDTKKK